MEDQNPNQKESVLSKFNTSAAETTSKSPMVRLFEKRWSPRAFNDKLIDRSSVRELFDSAKHAASCFNEQPWRILISENERQSYRALFDSMSESNQSWAQSAPLLGAVFSKRNFSLTGEPNPHSNYDCGAFMALASLRAVELGLHIHQMAGFQPSLVRSAFNISDEFDPITLFALGEIGELEEIPMKFWEKERDGSSRKDVDDFLFWEDWNENKDKSSKADF